jgi:NCAIR mutase (PurE)-related protein
MDASEITFDFDREQRLGLPEAVLCAGKTATQITQILTAAASRDHSLLLTRLSPEMHAQIDPESRLIDYESVSQTGFFGHRPGAAHLGRVAVVSAGTSDAPASFEAVRTLGFHNLQATLVMDVGVAGLWRLQARLEEIKNHQVVIVVAGMDGALASVIGGLVSAPVIVVPTSTGYGAARGGKTALAAALSSCAPGLLVCNIDNGYGAACAALRILGTP